jgi:RNA polymerase sigma-70 factor (ECF subfamily)
LINTDLKTENNVDELILRAQKGDKQAFREIVEKYKRFAFASAFKILLNEEDAKDAAQEAFIKLWKYLDRYKFEAKFTTWFYKIIINMSLDKLKSRKRKERVEIPRLSDSDIENLTGKEDYSFSNSELAEIITELTKKLSPKQRLVFTLRDLEGLDIAEVSGALNISAGSVKSNLVYARRKIKKYLTTIYKWK